MTKENNSFKIILRGFYRNILRKLWEDVEQQRIPPNIISGISKDIRIILYQPTPSGAERTNKGQNK